MSNNIKTIGHALGPMRFIPELGYEVGTFVDEPGGSLPALKWHVPLDVRGDFRPKDLANYDNEKDYRTDVFGWMLCYAKTKTGDRCTKRAQNRYPRCTIHGGRVHPLDKIDNFKQDTKDEQAQEISRYKQYLAGQITVEDLDDEELANCGFRGKNGTIYKPRNVPRDLVNAFTRAIYDRAQKELRANTVKAAQTMAEIMMNPTVEPDVRLKAANIIIERNLGKTPTVVAITSQAPWEEIFDGITSSTRESSRQRRGIIDAEIVGELEQRPDVATANESGSESDDNAGRDDTNEGNQTGSSTLAGIGGSDTGRNPLSDSTIGEGSSRSAVANERSSGVSEELKAKVRELTIPKVVDRERFYEHNEAILAQTIEVKPYDYQLRDHNAEIALARQKRIISQALGVDLVSPDKPLEVVETERRDDAVHFVPKLPDKVKITKVAFMQGDSDAESSE